MVSEGALFTVIWLISVPMKNMGLLAGALCKDDSRRYTVSLYMILYVLHMYTGYTTMPYMIQYIYIYTYIHVNG